MYPVLYHNRSGTTNKQIKIEKWSDIKLTVRSTHVLVESASSISYSTCSLICFPTQQEDKWTRVSDLSRFLMNPFGSLIPRRETASYSANNNGEACHKHNLDIEAICVIDKKRQPYLNIHFVYRKNRPIHSVIVCRYQARIESQITLPLIFQLPQVRLISL